MKYKLIGLSIIFILMPMLFHSFFPDTLDNNLLKDHLVADSFWHQKFANVIYEEGLKTNLIPAYMTGHTVAISPNPPLPYIPSVLLSEISRIHTNNTYMYLNFIFILIMISIIFLLTYKLNKNLGIITLSIVILQFKWPFSALISWGQWIDLFGLLLMMVEFALFVYFWPKVKEFKNKEYIKFGILLSLTLIFHLHTHDEWIHTIYIFGSVIAYDLFKTKDYKLFLKQILFFIITYGTAIILSLNELLKILQIWNGNVFFSSFGNISSLANKGFIFNSLGFYKYLVIAGIAIFFMLKKKEKYLPYIILFLTSFSNYFLGYARAVQPRMIWPIISAPIIGLTIITIFDKIKINKKKMFVIIAISILLINYSTIKTQDIQSILVPEERDSFNYLNNFENKTNLFLFGPYYSQSAMLWFNKDKSYIADINKISLDPLLIPTRLNYEHSAIKVNPLKYMVLVPNNKTINIKKTEDFKKFDFIITWKNYPNQKVYEFIKNKINGEIAYENQRIIIFK